ncbi:hypothetical protein OH541_19430, partial [Pseudomonas cichorii]
LFGRFRENPAWGPKLLLGRKTWIHTVAHAGLSAPKVPDWQEIRSTPRVDAVDLDLDLPVRLERAEHRRGIRGEEAPVSERSEFGAVP